MRPVCERCGARLDADGEAFICSFECTFCAACSAALRADLPELLRRARPPAAPCRALSLSGAA
jgi:uncharacterized protein